MKIKNIDLVQYDNALAQYANKKLPQRISYAITKNMIIVSKEIEAYRKSLEKIIDSYDEFIEKGNDGERVMLPIGVPKVDATHMTDYMNDINELLAIDVSIELYHISEEVFDYEDSDRYDALSAADIINLQKILCSEKSETVEE